MLPVAGGRFDHTFLQDLTFYWNWKLENLIFRLNPSHAWSLWTLHPLKCWILWRTRWTSSTNCFVYTALNIVGEMARIWDSMEMLKIILIIRGREWWIAIDLWRVNIMKSSPALFGCFDQDYDGCVHSADVKKNVEIVLQCTFLVVIVFPAIAHFQQTCQNYPNQTKKRFISIFIFGQGKCSLSPINLFQENIWRKHWFGLSAGNFTAREAIFLEVIFSRNSLSFLPSYFESWHLSEINSIFWNTCAIQYISCCTSFIQRNGGYFYTFRVL